MPSVSTISIHTRDHVSWIEYQSNDPRRNGRVDIAIFPTELLGFIKNVTFRAGEFYVEEESFTSFFSRLYGYHCRIEPNVDYFKRNFKWRESPVGAGNAKFLSTRRPKAKHEISYFPKVVGWKSKSEWCTIHVHIQKNHRIPIKINKFLVQYIPQKLFLPEGKNGLYLVDNDITKFYNDRHGRSLASVIIERCGGEDNGGRRLHRHDVLDYRVDPRNNEFVAAQTVKNTWRVNLGLLKIEHPAETKPWYPRDSHEDFRFPKGIATDVRLVYVQVDPEFAPRLQDYNWLFNDESDDVYSTTEDGDRVLLKRLVAEWAGMDIGPSVVPARMTKAYEKALNGDSIKHLRRRAKLENIDFPEQKGVNSRFTKPKQVKYRQVFAEKLCYWDFGQALDYRKESIRVNPNSNIGFISGD